MTKRILVLIMTLTAAAPSAAATAEAAPLAQERGIERGIERGSAERKLVGWGTGETDCSEGPWQCTIEPTPFSLTISAVPDGHVASFCDIHYSWCMGEGAPLWTVLFLFDCSTVVTAPAGETTFFAGAWVSVIQVEGFQWWMFKIVDRGPGSVDAIAISKEGPSRSSLDTRSTPIDDGACGASTLTTKPLIAGDFAIIDG